MIPLRCFSCAGSMGQQRYVEENTRETRTSKEDYRDQKERVRDRQLTMMTVAMTLAFFIFTAPTFIHLLLFRFHFDPKSSPETQTLYDLSALVVLIANTLNSSINFFLYTLTGSKFRSDFKKLIYCHQKRILKNKHHIKDMPNEK